MSNLSKMFRREKPVEFSVEEKMRDFRKLFPSETVEVYALVDAMVHEIDKRSPERESDTVHEIGRVAINKLKEQAQKVKPIEDGSIPFMSQFQEDLKDSVLRRINSMFDNELLRISNLLNQKKFVENK